MQGEFKQCPNGHYYQGTNCPYCKIGNQSGSSTSLKTEIFIGNSEAPTATTDTYNETFCGGRTQTTVIDGQNTIVGTQRPSQTPYNRTVFGDDIDDTPNNISNISQKKPQYGRKLVGWLVSYSFDELGVDFKLYEGRNIIGRDLDCNITVNDGRMSGKHAVLLFRANKYSITDSQSSHGTFVNDEDIELEPRYIKDGDLIRMGNTIFKFRTSL